MNNTLPLISCVRIIGQSGRFVTTNVWCKKNLSDVIWQWMATAGLITCINSLGKIMQALIRFYCLLLFWLVLTYHPSRDHSPYNNMCVCNVKTPRFWTSSVLCIAMGVFLQDNHAVYFSDTLHSFIVGYYSSILRINPGLGYSLGLLVPKGFPKSAIQASFSI